MYLANSMPTLIYEYFQLVKYKNRKGTFRMREEKSSAGGNKNTASRAVFFNT